jgi:hypothetical protein
LGAERFAGKVYGEALAHFRWVSVFGFFTHSNDERYAILKNLTSAWEKYLIEEGEDLEVALLWAKEAQQVNNTKQIQDQIDRIQATMDKN